MIQMINPEMEETDMYIGYRSVTWCKQFNGFIAESLEKA